MTYWKLKGNRWPLYVLAFLLLGFFNQATCKYSFKDTSPIPAEIKTFRVNYIENKASYVNTQLSPQITERLKQKIISTTRLQQTNNDDAHYDISGFVSQYQTSTVAVSGGNSSGNRLTVGFHLSVKCSLDEKRNVEADFTRTYDFSADKTITDVEASLNEEMVRNIVDEIFNKIFSNW
ncbi:MAG TPA: LPS assembly lipoprotein LptE [Ferruginibacter sp.]|nr:LPS assembly lipoprotein LptE [Ferruginibacter sp.]